MEARGGTDPPELQRTLGSFQVFAISFAFISVAVGIFANYDEVLQSTGPVGIWLWIVAAAGQILVALVVAQFAARISLSGSSYQWASRLANPKIGWGFGWLSFCFLAVAVVATANALASQAFMPLVGVDPSENTARVITLVVLVVEALVAVGSTRLVGLINSSAVVLELVIVVVLAIALALVVAFTGNGSVSNLTSRGVVGNDPDYFTVGGGLMLAMIMGLATLVGFDSAANLAEEAKDPFRTVPRAIVGSVVAASALGLLFLISLTIAIDDIPGVSESGSPVAAIMHNQLGSATERILLVAVTFAFFGAGTVTMASCSRLVFAMSRDSRFPAHQVLRRINPHTHTPIPATILILAVGFVLMIGLPGSALPELITASTILPALIYGATIVLYLCVRGQLGRQPGAFSLGCYEVPVAIGALVWSLVSLFVLVTPSGARVPVVVVIGLIVGGGVFFLGLLLFDRDALETEPDAELDARL